MTCSEIKSENYTINRKTVFHSRLPNYVFFDFHIAKSKPTQSQRTAPPLQGLLSKSTWERILSKPVLLPQSYESLEDIRLETTEHKDPDGDHIMETTNDELVELAEMSDFDSYNENKSDLEPAIREEFTIFVYHSSFSIDNGEIFPLSSQILTACMIPREKHNDGDTLLLYLDTGHCLLVNVYFDSSNRYIPYVVSETIIPLSPGWKPKNIVISKKNNTILVSSDKVIQVWDIVKNKNGRLSIHHRLNFKEENILNLSIIPISHKDDGFLITNYTSDILQLECLRKSVDVNIYSRVYKHMKNTFQVPLIVVPLQSTHGVLMLQETGYSIKSAAYFIAGDDRDSNNCSYPVRKTPLRVNAIYIPKKKITRPGFDHPTGVTHDQVLISSTNNYVHLLDVYYDARRHIYTSEMTPLFKYKHAMSFFKFELRDDLLYDFVFANEMGITESKVVKIVFDSSERPILKTVSTLWSEIYPYPIMDYEILQSPHFRNSIEDPSREFWALAGASSNHSLMSLKRGYKGKQLSNNKEKVFGAERIVSLRNGHVWVSTRTTNYIYKFDFELKQYLKALEVLPDCKVLELKYYGDTLLVIGESIICILDAEFSALKIIELPFKVILATILNGTGAVVYIDDNNQFQIAAFMIDNTGSIETISVDMKFNDDQQPTCLKILEDSHFGNYLFIGFANHPYLISVFNGMGFAKPSVLSLISGEGKSNNFDDDCFIPKTISCIDKDNNCIITSTKGEVVIFKLDAKEFANTTKSAFLQRRFKLADETCVDVIKSNEPGVVYLKGKFLWKYENNSTKYPIRVLFEELGNSLITCCDFDFEGNNLVLMRNHTLTLVETAQSVDTIIKSRRIGITCMKIGYFSYYDLLVLIPMPDLTECPPLIFAESRTMRFLKDLDITSCFEPDEKALCICECKLKRENKVYVNLIVGGRCKNGGFIKVINISKNGTIYVAKCTSTFKEPTTVTHIECFESMQKSLMFASFENQIVKYTFSCANDSLKIANDGIVLQLSNPIKKFSISQESDCVFSIYTVTRANYVVKSSYQDDILFSSKIGEETTADSTSDMLNICKDKEFNVLADFHNQSITVKSLVSPNETSINIGYFPRLANIESHYPWISILKREEANTVNFLTVGLNGEVDHYEVQKNKDLSADVEEFSPSYQSELFSNCMMNDPLYF